jgi:DNA-directed RNA polymerase specialized sigma24 family protein
MDGEARELEALYETRYVSFRNALATVTGSRESARDAVQEAFARALAGRRSRPSATRSSPPRFAACRRVAA